MNAGSPDLEARIAHLERSLRRTRFAAAIAPLVLLVTVGARPAERPMGIQDELITRRLVVLDEAGRPRVVIAQDPKDSQRRSRAAGLTLFDSTGAERGGFTTYDDGGIGLGMDAPSGVGAAMGERLSLWVGPDGAADVLLLDNLTRAVAMLHSAGNGDGGVQVFKWDMEGKKIHIRTVVYDGDRHETVPME